MTEKNIVRYTLSEIMDRIARGEDRTLDDPPEGPRESEDFWKEAKLVMPHGKTSVHLRVDSDVFDWFKAQGEGHLTRMNAVLRSFFEAHKH